MNEYIYYKNKRNKSRFKSTCDPDVSSRERNIKCDKILNTFKENNNISKRRKGKR